MNSSNEKLYRGIDRLVNYGLYKGLIQQEDRTYITNRYLELYGIDEYEPTKVDAEELDLEKILKELLEEAIRLGVLENEDIVSKDLFDTKLMGIMVPIPSQVIHTFRKLYDYNPKAATEYFYQFSQDTDYIRTYRIKKDMKWTVDSPYGDIDITINLSKPEKDPRAIAAAKLLNSLQVRITKKKFMQDV